MTSTSSHIRLKKTNGGSVFIIVATGTLGKEDYREFVPQLEWQIAKAGQIRLLIELVHFRGWTLGAFWEDIKFAVKHFNDVEKIAVVGGGNPWEHGMTRFFRPFTRAQVRFFSQRDKTSAEQWVSL